MTSLDSDRPPADFVHDLGTRTVQRRLRHVEIDEAATDANDRTRTEHVVIDGIESITVQVKMSWRHVEKLALKAADSPFGHAGMGPITVTVIKRETKPV